MKLNPPHRVRAAIYLATVIGTPVMVYLQAKGWIGPDEFILWGAEVTAVSGMAALNAKSSRRAPRGDAQRP